MSDLMRQLTSLSWWVGVVFVGILVSLVAAYVKPKTDHIIESISLRNRHKNMKRAEVRQRRVDLLRGCEHEQVMHMHFVNYTRLQSIGIMLLGVFVILLVIGTGSDLPKPMQTVGMAVGAFTIVMAFLYVLDAQSEADVLHEARRAPTTPPPLQ